MAAHEVGAVVERVGAKRRYMLGVLGALAFAGCHEDRGVDSPHGPPPVGTPPVEIDAGPPDAGSVNGSGTDGGSETPDGGPGEPDGGPGTADGGPGAPDAPDGGPGTPDGGPDTPDGGPVALPSVQGWQFYGVQHGGPHRALGISADEGGNLWVAGGAEGLFLLRPGAERFERFTAAEGLTHYVDPNGLHGYDVLSVAGARPGEVIVGYQGLGDSDEDPPFMIKSGDADRVTLTAGGITVTHFDISSPPGQDPHYPLGRDKIRHVHRVLYNHATGDIWFGGGHGVALYDGRSGQILEHQHAAINGYTAAGQYTLLSGDWSVALDAQGDLWMGGAHRLAKLRFAAEGRQFWARLDPTLDVWPDAVAQDATPAQRTDDFVQDLAVTRDGRLWIGSIPNSLAILGPSGFSYLRDGLVDPKITALEADPLDDSVWIGHLYGGLTRLKDGQRIPYDFRVFGPQIIEGQVPDIQSDFYNGHRRILVAFDSGVIALYTGP